jgi:hypothetical protein
VQGIVEDLVNTFLDLLAVLALAAGVTVGLWPHIHGWSIACGGAVVFVGVRVSEALADRKRGVGERTT